MAVPFWLANRECNRMGQRSQHKSSYQTLKGTLVGETGFKDTAYFDYPQSGAKPFPTEALER